MRFYTPIEDNSPGGPYRSGLHGSKGLSVTWGEGGVYGATTYAMEYAIGFSGFAVVLPDPDSVDDVLDELLYAARGALLSEWQGGIHRVVGQEGEGEVLCSDCLPECSGGTLVTLGSEAVCDRCRQTEDWYYRNWLDGNLYDIGTVTGWGPVEVRGYPDDEEDSWLNHRNMEKALLFPNGWYLQDYGADGGADHLALKKHNSLGATPEGSSDEWLALVKAIRKGEDYDCSTSLAWDTYTGECCSPRNYVDGVDEFIPYGEDDFADWLEAEVTRLVALRPKHA